LIPEPKFYRVYTDYSLLIEGMSEKVIAYKTKNPTADITSQLETIDKIRELQQIFHNLYQLLLNLENQQGRWMGERHRLLMRISQLEKENTNLKNNIL